MTLRVIIPPPHRIQQLSPSFALPDLSSKAGLLTSSEIHVWCSKAQHGPWASPKLGRFCTAAALSCFCLQHLQWEQAQCCQCHILTPKLEVRDMFQLRTTQHEHFMVIRLDSSQIKTQILLAEVLCHNCRFKCNFSLKYIIISKQSLKNSYIYINVQTLLETWEEQCEASSFLVTRKVLVLIQPSNS